MIAGLLLLLSAAAFSQTKSVEVMAREIASLHAEKSISLNFDAASNTSRLMLVAENFPDGDARRSDLMAMNFASGFFFAGNALASPPDRMMLTFWVKARRPQFAAGHELSFVLEDEVLTVGPARYAAKPDRQMEYLNYEIPREHLAKVAARSNAKVRLGTREFHFTPAQLKSLAGLLAVSSVARPD